MHKIPFLRDASEIIYTHQETFDGTGYPRGLRGEAIPLGARIFAIADTLDAMTSDRPYRKGLTFVEARQEIIRCSGSQFDPAIVQVFLDMPQELWSDLRREVERGAAAILGCPRPPRPYRPSNVFIPVYPSGCAQPRAGLPSLCNQFLEVLHAIQQPTPATAGKPLTANPPKPLRPHPASKSSPTRD